MTHKPTVVIMAAGEGVRMRPLTGTRPKAMLPVGGKPMLEHLLNECLIAGMSDFIFVVGYHDDKVRDYFGDGSAWKVGIRYALQRRALGTADALRQALPLIEGPVVVINGDVLLQARDIEPLSRAGMTTLSLTELADVSGKGVVEIHDEQVVRLHEKSAAPPARLVNAGVYYFSGEFLPFLEKTPLSPRGEYEITDTIQMWIDYGKTVACRMVNTWRELGYPWELLAANEEMLGHIKPLNEGVIEDGAVIKGTVSIGRGSIIRSGSYIVGPVIIGADCDIGPNCYIRPASAIGCYCHIGAGVEIKNSIIMSYTNVPHLSYVGDSVIGENCNLGAGSQIANLRFDHAPVAAGGRQTGRRKLGTVIGDNVSIGVNASINPGTMIGHGSCIGPGAVVSGVIAPGTRVF